MRIFQERGLCKAYVGDVLGVGGFPEILQVAGSAANDHKERDIRVAKFHFMHFQCRSSAMNTGRA